MKVHKFDWRPQSLVEVILRPCGSDQAVDVSLRGPCGGSGMRVGAGVGVLSVVAENESDRVGHGRVRDRVHPIYDNLIKTIVD
jgi:hypothetical protein